MRFFAKVLSRFIKSIIKALTLLLIILSFFDFQEITLSDNELQEMEETLKEINNLIDNEKLFIQQMKGFKDFCLNKMFC